MADSTEQNQDFGAILDRYLPPARTSFQVGQKVKATITAIDRNTIFLDLGGKSEAIMDRIELLDGAGELTVKVGDAVEAYCLSVRDDGVHLTRRMTGRMEDEALREAYLAGIPVEGRVGAERKGGYEVTLTGGQSAFCPYSQIDLFKRDAAVYLGEKFLFVIATYEEDGGNLVLSRRRYLERERVKEIEKLKESLKAGDVMTGTVRKLMPFGAFVDIGGGIEGLVPLRELSWSRNVKPEDFLQVGETVITVVLETNWEGEKPKITLSLRNAEGDPWSKVSGGYMVGMRVSGTVTRLMPFGAFVELEPGIEGLVHVSRMGRRVNLPDEVVKVGDVIEVTIDVIDQERRRIGLSIESSYGKSEPATQAEAGKPAAGAARPDELQVGSEVTGTVDSIRDFGVFVKLPDSRTGLLHVSQVELRGSSNRMRALHDAYPPGSEVKVVIREIDGKRVSLTLRETLDREAAELEAKDFEDQGGKGLGSLGDAFGKLNI